MSVIRLKHIFIIGDYYVVKTLILGTIYTDALRVYPTSMSSASLSIDKILTWTIVGTVFGRYHGPCL